MTFWYPFSFYFIFFKKYKFSFYYLLFDFTIFFYYNSDYKVYMLLPLTGRSINLYADSFDYDFNFGFWVGFFYKKQSIVFSSV